MQHFNSMHKQFQINSEIGHIFFLNFSFAFNKVHRFYRYHDLIHHYTLPSIDFLNRPTLNRNIVYLIIMQTYQFVAIIIIVTRIINQVLYALAHVRQFIHSMNKIIKKKINKPTATTKLWLCQCTKESIK